MRDLILQLSKSSIYSTKPQDAANSADNLKMHNSFYYNALYANHLEMMYFLIEPVITGVPYLNPMIISDDELAELLIKLMR
ncbi:hypothetical protein DMS69_20295 [Klebsiella pneumoniae]|nr:hypothetical protein DMS69_20295 [Klebsiella pneumoniae]